MRASLSRSLVATLVTAFLVSACGNSSRPTEIAASSRTSTSAAVSSSTTSEGLSGVPVETDHATFVMPTAPEVRTEDVADETFGVQGEITRWTAEVGDLYLAVMLLEYGDLLTREGASTGALAAVIAGAIKRTGGTPLKEESFFEDGREGRRAVVALDGGQIFLNAVVNGNVMAFFTTAGTSGAEDAHRRLLDGFEWRV